ncbi:Mitoc L55 domain containing protein [Trichuris trichiura]|uniref:Mitoc L55 domain containing protein n=1 Tax=Trichuris trichiura TaxID=36087 RepID=A0A077ZGK7_TRITR|nr:Mitoc L55 domain containing protein [Trichuris trichiura]
MTSTLLKTRNCIPATAARLDCYMASLRKVKRKIYRRLYPVMMVLPDGSAIMVRFNEPRQIIKLPVDLSSLSEAERRERLAARRPTKKEAVSDISTSYSHKNYAFLWKKDTHVSKHVFLPCFTWGIGMR